MLYDVNAFNSIFQSGVNPACAGRAQALKNERSELVACSLIVASAVGVIVACDGC